MSLSIRIKGIDDFERYLKEQPDRARQAAMTAINDTARKSYAEAKRRIMADVNLSASYLDGRGEAEPRLKITRFAKENDLRAIITGRQRATSLRRFEAHEIRSGKKRLGVSVQVKKSGPRKTFRSGWIMKLKNGNLGLAYRAKAGEELKNRKYPAQPLSNVPNVYLLYGPSVQQLFNRIAPDMVPEVEKTLGQQFRRQFARLNNGR